MKTIYKRLIILFFLISSVCVYFWSQLRYPRLNEKESFFERNVTSEIYFDTFIQYFREDSPWLQILKKTMNWYYTNWQGMSFGLILAAGILTMLYYVKIQTGRNRFINAALGSALGAPQGICANCSTPVAASFHQSNFSKHTFITMLMSSPTLNVVSLSLLATILASKAFFIYLSSLIFFLLVVVPLVLGKDRRKNGDQFKLKLIEISEPESWLKALWTVLKQLTAQLIVICKRTVPFMLLAGFLGTLLVHHFPLSDFRDNSWSPEIFVAVATLATLLPVPIMFDVTVGHFMLASGIPAAQSLMVVFCLGIFSIYPLLQFRKALGLLTSVKLFLGVVTMGLSVAWFSHLFIDQSFTHFYKDFQSLDLNGNQKEKPELPNQAPNTIKLHAKTNSVLNNLSVVQYELRKKNNSSGRFIKQQGPSMGISPERNFAVIDFMFSESLAVGDLNGDLWPDIVISARKGFEIYINQGDKGFYRVVPTLSSEHQALFESPTFRLALVDHNNDGRLDIFAGSSAGEIFVVLNQGQSWNQNPLVRLFQFDHKSLLQGVAAADVNKDQQLDYYLFFGSGFIGPSKDPMSRNRLMISNIDTYQEAQLNDDLGHSLCAQFVHLNQDNLIDLYACNDLSTPDNVYLGVNTGKYFEKIKKSDKLIPASATYTMGVASGDFNNDLQPDIYTTGISPPLKQLEVQYCEEKQDEQTCDDITTLINALTQANSMECHRIQNSELKTDCLAWFIFMGINHTSQSQLCQQFDKVPFYQQICDYVAHHRGSARRYIASKEDIPQMRGNVLLEGTSSSSYLDVSKQTKVNLGNFGWNTQFIDIDNDQWQDIYIATNQSHAKHGESNVLFHNSHGKAFEVQQEEFGLDDIHNTYIYVSADFDLDGDIDILSKHILGSYVYYDNQVNNNNSIQIQLIDENAHTSAIGARVIIYYRDRQNNELSQFRQITSGGGFNSYQRRPLHFGLGQVESIGSIEIFWPEGNRQKIDGPFETNHLYQVTRQKSRGK